MNSKVFCMHLYTSFYFYMYYTLSVHFFKILDAFVEIGPYYKNHAKWS